MASCHNQHGARGEQPAANHSPALPRFLINFAFSASRKRRLRPPGAEDVGERTRSGYVQRTAARSERGKRGEPVVRREDVPMALGRRRNPRLGVVLLGLRPHGDPIPAVFPILLFASVVSRLRRARGRHSDRRRHRETSSPGIRCMLHVCPRALPFIKKTTTKKVGIQTE